MFLSLSKKIERKIKKVKKGSEIQKWGGGDGGGDGAVMTAVMGRWWGGDGGGEAAAIIIINAVCQ